MNNIQSPNNINNRWNKFKMKNHKTALIALIAVGTITISSRPVFCQESHDGHDHSAHAAQQDQGSNVDSHADEVVLTEEAIGLFNITTRFAEHQVLSETITVPARVGYNTEAMAHIGTQVSGRVSEIAVRLGEQVEKGQLLLIIDSPELGMTQSEFLQRDASVDAARTNVEAAKELVEVARISFERAEKLQKSNGISITDYLERQGALRETEANVRRAQAELRITEAARLAAENQLHIYGYRHEDCDNLLASGEVFTRYEVYAPISGRVIEREVTPGEVVAPDNEALMILAGMDELWVLGDVPELHIGRLAMSSPARIAMTALPEMTFDGEVSYIAPHLDPQTRTLSVRIAVPPADAALHEDESADEHVEPHAPSDLHEHDDDNAHTTDSDDDHDIHDESHAGHKGHGKKHGEGDVIDDGHDEHNGLEEDTHDHSSDINEHDNVQAHTEGDSHVHDDALEDGVEIDDGHGHLHAEHEEHLDHQSEFSEPQHGNIGLLIPGMFGQVELELTAIPGHVGESVLAVPEEAIQDVEGGPVVFVSIAGEPNTFSMRPIRTGPRVGHWVPVLSGLAEGEEYVATNTFILKAEFGKEGAEHAHAH